MTSKASPNENRCNNFPTKIPTKILGNAGRLGIFTFEEFPHESGCNHLHLAQIPEPPSGVPVAANPKNQFPVIS